MKYSDIGKFEKKFNLSINVYDYRLEKSKAKKVRGVSFAPRYITRNIIDNPENVISLLHMKQGEKSHFVLIKSLSALMYQNYNGNGNGAVHLCPCCFKSYRTRDLLTEHLKNGCAKYGDRAICQVRGE